MWLHHGEHLYEIRLIITIPPSQDSCPHKPFTCQRQNSRGQRSKVIDKSTLQNRVMYYIREEYYLAMV